MPLKPKPIDRWLTLVTAAMAGLTYLFAKTPIAVILCVIIMFALLIHPLWHLWWIEDRTWRRLSALSVLAIGLAVAAVAAWPEMPTTPAPLGPSRFSLLSGKVLVGLAYVIGWPWRWILATAVLTMCLTLLVERRWHTGRSQSETPNSEPAKADQSVVVSDSLRGCQDEWLHEKLKTDKATIWDLVWVASIFYRPDFDKSQPRIDFVFNIINNSLIDVLISMEGGYILFSDDSEQFYFDPKFMGPNPVLCKSRDIANFTIRQAVTGDEITKHFKGTDNTRISFGNLSVSFRGTERFPEITSTHLDVNHYLFTAEGAWYNPNRPKFLSEQESDLQRVQIASPKPKITLIKDSGKRVYLNARTDTYTFFAASSGNPAVVARFRNEAETSVPVKGVRARIVYFDANGEERGNVSHGAWLDEPYNYTDFAVGGERTLVLGGTEDSQWVRGTAGAEGFWRQVTLEGLSTIQDNREGPAKAKQKPTWGKVLDKHIRIKVTLYTDSGPIGSDFCFEFIPGTPFTFRPIECQGMI